jgi:two-component system response regulator ParR
MYALSTLYKQTNPITESQVAPITRVLIIDDDHETTDLLKIILEPNAFDVQMAHSGQDGIEMARTLQPDVIVLDLFMPEMDGMAVCRAIRAFCKAPIVMLSAYDKPGAAEQALENGADDYLVKPMNSSLLVASLHRLARRARAEQSAKGLR